MLPNWPTLNGHTDRVTALIATPAAQDAPACSLPSPSLVLYHHHSLFGNFDWFIY